MRDAERCLSFAARSSRYGRIRTPEHPKALESAGSRPRYAGVHSTIVSQPSARAWAGGAGRFQDLTGIVTRRPHLLRADEIHQHGSCSADPERGRGTGR